MPAPGTIWASHVWGDDVWAANVWADAVPASVITSVLNSELTLAPDDAPDTLTLVPDAED
jgi:hypothetical protein